MSLTDALMSSLPRPSVRIRYVCLFPSLGDLIIDMILFRTVREIEILMGQIVHYKRTVYIAFKEYFIF